jgi:dihydrofolate reductase
MIPAPRGDVILPRVRYAVAASLDGYIAGPHGEADWIIMDPDIDFSEIYREFDTLLIGRKTFETMAAMGGGPDMPGMTSFVFSRTLRQQDQPKMKIVAENAEQMVQDLKSRPGKDIWLFGGGVLFRSLSAAGLVDTVEVALIPVLLHEGIPLAPGPADQLKLALTRHKIYTTGIVSLEYSIKPG